MNGAICGKCLRITSSESQITNFHSTHLLRDAYAKDPSSVLEWQQRYMNFMFDLEDASDDGTIDASEFAMVCSSYGLDTSECEDAFNKMSRVSSIQHCDCVNAS